MLVHCEQHDNFESAITREKALKKWNRKWKLNLIERTIRIGMNFLMKCVDNPI
jgi:putative endonuclease